MISNAHGRVISNAYIFKASAFFNLDTAIIKTNNRSESIARLINPRLFLINLGNNPDLKINGVNMTESPNVTARIVVNNQSPPLYIRHVISNEFNDNQKAANVQRLLYFLINNGKFNKENTINSDDSTIKNHVGLWFDIISVMKHGINEPAYAKKQIIK